MKLKAADLDVGFLNTVFSVIFISKLIPTWLRFHDKTDGKSVHYV